jgi:CO dehydrogenase/acetyl-CoA synthase beta subunit
MSSVLKETMSDEFKAVCEREGDPDFMGKIADEKNVTSVEDLLAWLEAHNHPAMAMEAMF